MIARIAKIFFQKLAVPDDATESGPQRMLQTPQGAPCLTHRHLRFARRRRRRSWLRIVQCDQEYWLVDMLELEGTVSLADDIDAGGRHRPIHRSECRPTSSTHSLQ